MELTAAASSAPGRTARVLGGSAARNAIVVERLLQLAGRTAVSAGHAPGTAAR